MKVNENGTLLKVTCLILLNIFSVFPTYVGMFLTHVARVTNASGLPHACGDVPVPVPKKHGVVTYHSVFPTNVWMFLFTFLKIFSLPHARGDVHGV